MKYIIKESQYNMILEMEKETELWLKRRYNVETMREFIEESKTEIEPHISTFNDEFDYADAVIDGAVDNFLYMDESVYESSIVGELEEDLITMCKDEFGEELLEYYRNNCEE